MSTQKKKKLKVFDIVLFTFAAIFVLDSFTAAAAIGWQSIVWLLIFSVIYFLPYGFISAELGSALGSEGGIYTWVKRAFGHKLAIRTTWYYWINVALWMPSVYIVFSSSLSYVIYGKDEGFGLWTQIGIAIALIVLTTVLNFLSIDKLKWLPNLTSVAKMIVTVTLVVGAIVWLSQGKSPSTAVDDPNFGFIPSWSKGIMFLPVIIYNLSGFELSSNASSDIGDPKKTIPKSIIIAGLTIVVAYVLGTAAVNIILDVEKIDISNGIIDAITNAIGDNWFVKIIACFLLFTFFGNMITWTAGANRSIIESSESGQFPKVFGSKLKSTDAPFYSSIITGIVSIIVVVLAGAISHQEGKISDLFWSIYAFSSVIFLLPYLFIFPSYLKLRVIEPNLERPFKNKGGLWFQTIISLLPTLIVVISIILYIFGSVIVGEKQLNLTENGAGVHIIFCLVGSLITILIGELIIYLHNRSSKRSFKNG